MNFKKLVLDIVFYFVAQHIGNGKPFPVKWSNNETRYYQLDEYGRFVRTE